MLGITEDAMPALGAVVAINKEPAPNTKNVEIPVVTKTDGSIYQVKIGEDDILRVRHGSCQHYIVGGNIDLSIIDDALEGYLSHGDLVYFIDCDETWKYDEESDEWIIMVPDEERNW